MNAPSFPDHAEKTLVRVVWIPEQPWNPKCTSGFEYTIDLRPLLMPSPNTVDTVLLHLPAWTKHIKDLADDAKKWVKAIHKERLIHMKVSSQTIIGGKEISKTELKEMYLVQDEVYVTWQRQADWLQSAYETLASISLPGLQTYSANTRKQFAPGMAPPFIGGE